MADLFASSTVAAASELPCISLWQPYATLIAIEAKPWETRHWSAPARLIGKRIAIHAAARKPTMQEIEDLQPVVGDALGFCHWNKRIPYGAVVCTAVLAGCHQVREHDGFTALLSDGRTIADDDFGDYSVGRWCWEMRQVQTLDPPIAAKGAQGWWTWRRAD